VSPKSIKRERGLGDIVGGERGLGGGDIVGTSGFSGVHQGHFFFVGSLFFFTQMQGLLGATEVAWQRTFLLPRPPTSAEAFLP